LDVAIKVEPGAGVAEKKIAAKNNEKNQKTKKPTWTCKYCHIVGHERKTNKNCLLSTNGVGKHYKPENVTLDPYISLPAGEFVYVSLFHTPDI
jgi:hypothetical protein